MNITDPTTAHDAHRERVRAAASHLYDAEWTLHIAHQTKVDAWIAAANERLHEAITEHLAALAHEQVVG